jgi:hypothetical protein
MPARKNLGQLDTNPIYFVWRPTQAQIENDRNEPVEMREDVKHFSMDRELSQLAAAAPDLAAWDFFKRV